MGLNQTERYVENRRALDAAKAALPRAKARLRALVGYDARPICQQPVKHGEDLRELSDARERVTTLEKTIRRLQTEIDIFYAEIGHVEP